MMFQCVRCQVTWGEGNPEAEGYSHGLCFRCLKEKLTPIYLKRQREEFGSFECFGTAEDFCDQEKCTYREICLRH
jgi:hypothetical protein